MRELVINAFAHRSYLEHNAPVFLAIYDTRVEITSPGGFPRGQTAERAVAGYSKIRNEVLAKALNYMRFIEEWGSGLKRVNEELGEYGIGKVSVDDAGFAVRMNVYRNQARGGETVNPKNASKKRTGATVNATVSATVNATVSDMIVEIVRANPGIRRPRLLEHLPTIKRGTLTRRLSDLSGVIEFRGAPKTGGYYCK